MQPPSLEMNYSNVFECSYRDQRFNFQISLSLFHTHTHTHPHTRTHIHTHTHEFDNNQVKSLKTSIWNKPLTKIAASQK